MAVNGLLDSVVGMWPLNNNIFNSLDVVPLIQHPFTHEAGATISIASTLFTPGLAKKFSTGTFNRMKFDDSSGQVFAAGDNDFTIMCWVFSFNGANNPYLAKWPSDGVNNSWILFNRSTTNSHRFTISDDGSATETIVEVANPDSVGAGSVWQLVIAGYDSVTEEIWMSVDGSAKTRVAHTGGAFGGGNSELTIGWFATLFGGHNQDETAYWNRQLSDADITAIWNGGAGLRMRDWDATVPIQDGGQILLDLVSWWDLTDASGGDRIDLHSGNNNLSETGAGAPIDQGIGLPAIANSLAHADFSSNPASLEFLEKASPVGMGGGADSFTVAGFFEFNPKEGDLQGFMSRFLEAGNDRQFALGALNGPSAKFFFDVSSDGTTGGESIVISPEDYSSSPVGPFGIVRFVVAWYDGDLDTLNIQLSNGVVTTASGPATIFNATVGFQIGHVNFFIPQPLDGGAWACGYWRRVLTQAERTFLYNAFAGRTFAELVAAQASTGHAVSVFSMKTAGWREGRFSGSVSVRAAASNVAGYLRQTIQPTDNSSSDSPLGSPGGNSDDFTTRRVRNYYTIPPAAWWQQYRLRMDMAESALNRKEDGFRYYLRLYKHLQTLRFDGPCVTEGLLGRSFIHPNNPSADEDIRWPGVVGLNALQLQFRWLPNFGCVDLDTDLELARFEIDASNFLSLKALAGDKTQREYNQHDIHGPHEPTLRLSKTRLGSEVASVDLVTYWGYDLREPSLERLDDVLLLTIQHNTVGLSLRVDKYGGFGEKRTADDLTAFAGNGLGDIVYNGSGYYGPPVVVDENVDRAIDGVRRRVRSSRPDLARRLFVQERNMVAAGERDTTNGQRVEDQPFLLEEDFNRSDDANLGSSWDIIRQTGNGFNIVSNKASCTDDGFERWDAAPRHRDYVIEADVAVAADADLVGVIGRYPNEFFNSDFASSPTVGGGIGMELVQLTPTSAELRLVAWWLDVRGLTYDMQALSTYTAGVEYRMQLTLSGSTITGTIAEIGTGTILATVSGTSTLFPKPGRIVIYGEAPTSPVTINRIVAIPNFVTDLT